MISVDYEYNVPNSYLVDHSFSEGKTRETTYDGPDKIYLVINNETGKEETGPVTAEWKADGRPVPLNCRYVEIDCVENPLLCQLRAPIIDEAEEDHTGSVIHPECVPVDGYRTFTYQTPVLPFNIYDKNNIHVDENDNVTIPVKTALHELYGGARSSLPDWDFVKSERNYKLQHSDSQLALDMPEALAAEWKTYRQRLRDMPAALQAAGVPPHIAVFMFPESPDDLAPPKGS